MNAQQAILKAMEVVVGLEQEELMENLDLNLIESGLIDSLTIVSLISEVEKYVGKKIAIKQISPEDFITINKLTAAIAKQLA